MSGFSLARFKTLQQENAQLKEELTALRNLQAIVNRDGGQASIQDAIDRANRYKFQEDELSQVKQRLSKAISLIKWWRYPEARCKELESATEEFLNSEQEKMA